MLVLVLAVFFLCLMFELGLVGVVDLLLGVSAAGHVSLSTPFVCCLSNCQRQPRHRAYLCVLLLSFFLLISLLDNSSRSCWGCIESAEVCGGVEVTWCFALKLQEEKKENTHVSHCR